MNKKAAISTCLLIVIVIVSAFVFLGLQQTADDLESVTFGTLPNEAQSLIYIAENQQFFKDSGLNVTIKPYMSGLTAVRGVTNGEVDVAVATEFIVVAEALNNQSITTFASISKSYNFFVVARADQGITNASGLEGKTVGIALGTIAQFYLSRFLELNGIDQSSITIVNVPFNQAKEALENGTVNAVLTPQPYVRNMQNAFGDKIVVWQAQADQAAYTNLVCKTSWATQHTDLIKRILKSLVEAETFAIKNPQQAKSIVSKTLNYEESYLPTVWSNYQFTVSLVQAQISTMQDEARWLIINNLTGATSVPNITNHVFIDGLKSVKPQAVNIIG